MKSSFSVISFMGSVFGVVSTKSSPSPRSSRFFPVLSSSSFTVLCFTFMSVVHFELIFVESVRSVQIYFLHRDIQLFQHHLFLPQFSFFVPLSKMSLHFLSLNSTCKALHDLAPVRLSSSCFLLHCSFLFFRSHSIIILAFFDHSLYGRFPISAIQLLSYITLFSYLHNTYHILCFLIYSFIYYFSVFNPNHLFTRTYILQM